MKQKQYIFICLSYYRNTLGDSVAFIHKAYKKEDSAKAFCKRNSRATYEAIQLI